MTLSKKYKFKELLLFKLKIVVVVFIRILPVFPHDHFSASPQKTEKHSIMGGKKSSIVHQYAVMSRSSPEPSTVVQQYSIQKCSTEW